MYLTVTPKALFNKTKIIFFLLLLFLTSCTPITPRYDSKLIKKTGSHPSTTSSSATHIELFVMSQCPYGIEAEKVIIPVIKEFGDQIDFHLYFIAEEAGDENSEIFSQNLEEKEFNPSEGIYNGLELDKCRGEAVYEGGRFKSLHGQAEIEEDIRQTIIAQYYPQRFLDYLLHRAENYHQDDWEQAAVSAWIDCDQVKQLVKDEGENLFLENIQRAKEMNISASPTLLINGKRTQGPISQWSFSRILCRQNYHAQNCPKIPVCGHDFDCRSEDRVGVCLNPDTPGARCRFTDPISVKLEVIKAADCPLCDHKPFLQWAEKAFPGIETIEIDPNTSEGKKLIQNYSVRALPAYFFDPNIQKTARYSKIKEKLQRRNDRYLLSDHQIKVSSLIDRPLKKESLELFTEGFSSQGLMAAQSLIRSGLADAANFGLHFLAKAVNQKKEPKVRVLNLVPSKGNNLLLTPRKSRVVFQALGGLKEIQEDIRQLCLSENFPELYLPYLECVANYPVSQIKEGKSLDCLKGINLEEKDLKPCTHGRKGVDLLLREIDLAGRLGIEKSPTYLINNKILLKEAPPDFAAHIFRQMNDWDKE